jgi:hypothetical protein
VLKKDKELQSLLNSSLKAVWCLKRQLVLISSDFFIKFQILLTLFCDPYERLAPASMFICETSVVVSNKQIFMNVDNYMLFNGIQYFFWHFVWKAKDLYGKIDLKASLYRLASFIPLSSQRV